MKFNQCNNNNNKSDGEWTVRRPMSGQQPKWTNKFEWKKHNGWVWDQKKKLYSMQKREWKRQQHRFNTEYTFFYIGLVNIMNEKEATRSENEIEWTVFRVSWYLKIEKTHAHKEKEKESHLVDQSECPAKYRLSSNNVTISIHCQNKCIWICFCVTK